MRPRSCCLSKSQERIKTSKQVVRISPSRPSDRHVANSAPRLLQADDPSFSGCHSVCLRGGLINTETWRCWKEMCPRLYCQDIDRLQVPVDTSIQPVTVLLQMPQMQQMGMAHMSSILTSEYLLLLLDWSLAIQLETYSVNESSSEFPFPFFKIVRPILFIFWPHLLQVHLSLCWEVLHRYRDLLQARHWQSSRCLQLVCHRQETEDSWWDPLVSVSSTQTLKFSWCHTILSELHSDVNVFLCQVAKGVSKVFSLHALF